MKLEKLVGDRFKERPADCVIDSHALMVKGGYIKYVANGIYSSFLPLKRITRKIEQILREEMDKVDGQEVQFPVVMPASIWEESGRYESIGDELLRFTDRNGAKMVLGMTHEEAAVQLVREYAQSYTKYPFMIYQIHQMDAEKRGIAIGEERGEKRERLNNAKGMLHEGLSADLISRVTGLSIAEINKLKAAPNAN